MEGLYRPVAQLKQASDSRILPAAVPYFPTGQSWQADTLAPYFPGWHPTKHVTPSFGLGLLTQMGFVYPLAVQRVGVHVVGGMNLSIPAESVVIS